jgi:para-aminobenzoate synthetase component 1
VAQLSTAGGPPWEVFATASEGLFPFFLDRADDKRPSFSGCDPTAVLVIGVDGTAVEISAAGSARVDLEPVAAITSFIVRSEAAPTNDSKLPDGSQKWVLPRTVGYLAYELGSWIESVPAQLRDAVGEPLAVLATYRRVNWWDPQSQSQGAIIFEDDRKPAPSDQLERATVLAPTSDFEATSRDQYFAGFDRIQAGIRAGEIYQANLSRRLRFEAAATPSATYQHLRSAHPVPHGSFLDYGSFAVLSNSPESFLHCDGTTMRTLPIKGTCARSGDGPADREASSKLLADPKEAAEHLMIVDLERNDLGRIAEVSSVRVDRFAELRPFPTLYHIESSISATLKSEFGLSEILRATFPGGSITGAPKVRAMQVIAETEGSRRGIYTGAIGCWNGERCMDLAMGIRTGIMVSSRLYYSSGGGLVSDSQAEAEWAETETKTQAFRNTLGQMAGKSAKTPAGSSL